MKFFKKAMILALLTASTIGFMTGCGSSDKFAGEWASEPDFSKSRIVNPKIGDFMTSMPYLSTVKIEKNGDAYVVTEICYDYQLKTKSAGKGSGVKFKYPLTGFYLGQTQKYEKKLLNYKVPADPMEKVIVEDEAGLMDYNFTLKKRTFINQRPATVSDNGTTLAIKVNSLETQTYTYMEKDGTLVIPFAGNTVLKKTNKDSVKEYMENFRNKVREILDKKDQEIKDEIAQKDMMERFVYLSGDVKYDDTALNK